jgi:hypothetical protein
MMIINSSSQEATQIKTCLDGKNFENSSQVNLQSSLYFPINLHFSRLLYYHYPLEPLGSFSFNLFYQFKKFKEVKTPANTEFCFCFLKGKNLFSFSFGCFPFLLWVACSLKIFLWGVV